MNKSGKRHPTEIRFSPLSLLCLFFCWVCVSGLAFYLGILAGRTDQMREIRRVYRAEEKAVAEEEIPPLSFEESLMAPGDEPEVPPPSPLNAHPLSPPSQPTTAGDGIESKVLQIASFRKPGLAEDLVRQLREKGYPCFQTTSGPSESGEPYCRVFVGPLTSTEMALQTKERLEQREGYSGILIRSLEQKEAKF